MSSKFVHLKISLSIALIFMVSTAFAYLHPAELRIVNNSQRQLTVKVMKVITANESSKLITVEIDTLSTETINISETGNYYLKTRAVYPDRDPIYKKGDPFKAYVGSDGYSMLTITYSINESSLPNPMAGEQISKSEFDND